MFNAFTSLLYKELTIADYDYLVVGQVCIARAYRGKGILDKAYEAYKKQFSKRYDLAITEIAASNQRSMNAHKRIGFKKVHQYTDCKNITWYVVVWDWR